MARKEHIYNQKRVPLWEVIPLDTPFVIEVEPTSFCNLKCKYCLHSLPRDAILNSGHVFLHMSDETFELLLKQTQEFPHKVKQIGFAGMGEPLLHKKLPYMIERAKREAGVERVTVTTNGVALSHQLSEDLINAGLDHMKISVNGLSDGDFKLNCGTAVDFERYLEQIEYLYQHRQHAEIACKIMDSCVGDNENLFYEKFHDICDVMSIEKTVRVFHEVSYDGIIETGKNVLSRYDMRDTAVRVCASPFFRLAVKANGTVSTCRLYNGLTVPGFNMRKQSLVQIWNSDDRREMLQGVLKGRMDGLNASCFHCTLKDDFAFESDILDDHADELYAKLTKGSEVT